MRETAIIRLREMYEQECQEINQNITNLVMWRAGCMNFEVVRIYDSAIIHYEKQLNAVVRRLKALKAIG